MTAFGELLRDKRTQVSMYVDAQGDRLVHFEFKDRLLPMEARGQCERISGIEQFAITYLARLNANCDSA